MAEWTLQHSAEIVDGLPIKTTHLTDNFNALKSDIDDRLSITTASAQTVAGAVTWTSQATFTAGLLTNTITERSGGLGVTIENVRCRDGATKFGGTAPASPDDGETWWDNTAKGFYGRNNGSSIQLDGHPVNAQTGTTYTILKSDRGKLVTFSNASSVAVTLPQATTSGFEDGFYFDVVNLGAGTVTITPTTSTIDTESSLDFSQNQGSRIFSDATDYFTNRGRPENKLGAADYDSGNQTITAAGLLTLAHSLGEVPVLIKAYLVCTTTQANWAVNDEYDLSAHMPQNATTLGTGAAIYYDSTNIYVRFGSNSNTFIGLNKTTGAYANFTNSSWRLVIRAWL